MPETIEALQKQRAELVRHISRLGDLRSGSITTTTGRGGKANCHCHQPNHPGHRPHLRLTHKVQGKSVTETLSHPAEGRKAEREIAEFRRF